MSQLLSNTTGLQEVLEALQTKAAGGEQATPEISVSSNGLITATAGTKSSTHQLAFQAAKTITPSTASQIAVSSGYYTGGDITVAAIPSSYVIPSGTLTISTNGTHDVKNYASAVVNVESSGSGEAAEWSEAEDAIISRSISGTYMNDRVTSIGSSAFCYCSNLTTASFPVCSYIGSNAFYYCSKLTTVSFPVCSYIGVSAFYRCSKLTPVSFPTCTRIENYAFYYCSSLTSVSFPGCSYIGNNAFYNCYSLTTASFPVCSYIGSSAFCYCSNLTTVSFPVCSYIGNSVFHSCYSLTTASFPVCTSIGSAAFYLCRTLLSLTLGASTVCTLVNSTAFKSTPYAGYSTYFSGTPYIYVPSSLVYSYKTATNWTYFSSYISAIGRDSGSGEIIEFCIENVIYQAEDGMIWADWVESEYNTDGYTIFLSNYIVDLSGDYCVYLNDFASICTPNDVIIANYEYCLDVV